MRHACWLIGVGLLAGAACAQPPRLVVLFIQPERYTDAAYARAVPRERDRAEVQQDIEHHLRGLVDRRLAAEEALQIEVLDIDLAGRFEPFTVRPGADVRIVRDITSPRLTLRYVLWRGSEVVRRGEEQVSDMAFAMTANRYAGSDRLRVEKAMLDDWFDQRFVHRR